MNNYQDYVNQSKWIDSSRFIILSAICDTFIPSYDITTLNENEIIEINKKSISVKESYDFNRFKSIHNYEAIEKSKDFFKLNSNSFHVSELFVKTIEENALDGDKLKVYILLWILSYSLGCFLLTGYFAPFNKLTLNQRTIAMNRWKRSYLSPIRGAFMTFKRLTAIIFFSFTERGESNPNWTALKYSPESVVAKPNITLSNEQLADLKTIRSKINSQVDDSGNSNPNSDLYFDVDVVVVGSGSGGGIISSKLAEHGLSVLLLEKGGYYDAKDFAQWRESEAFSKAFERGGLLSSEDGTIAILAASTVGGGSTINWSASFKTPAHVLKDWELEGLPIFKPGGEFEKSLNNVCNRLGVNDLCSYHHKHEEDDHHYVVNNNNRLLWEGAVKLGYTPEKIPRNVKNCVDCGHCCYGCPYLAKQSTLTNSIAPLLLKKENLRVISNCRVNKVVIEGGIATGIEGQVFTYPNIEGPIRQSPLSVRNIIVKAKIVVSSCGSLHTPALLLRSGLKHPLIGRHLTLHPVVGVGGVFPGMSTGLSIGVSMGVVVKSNDFDGKQKGYGIVIQTPPVHPGVLALAMPWNDGLSYKLDAMYYNNMSFFIGICRDKSSYHNRITIDISGEPVIIYNLTNFDRETVLQGLIHQVKLMHAAGAEIIISPNENQNKYIHSSVASIDNNNLNKFINETRSLGIVDNTTACFSAHQMGSCRMGKSRKEGVVQITGELYDCKNLYVADASLFPTSLGVNPMITTAAFADYVALQILKVFEIKPIDVDF